MYWADKIAKEIIASGKYKPYWVDDMKTPSGKIHVGSLRGTVIHDLVYKALLDQGPKAKFTWVFDNHDPMDGMPVYLEKAKWAKYLGMPLFQIPAPDGKAENYARYFANEFIQVFNQIGCQPQVLWASDFYLSGRMNDDIRLCLDKTAEIKKIYEKTYKKKLPADWYPFQVVCPKCGKESTTKVTAWDGEKVSFECRIDAVDWTKGCGTKGKVSPFSQKDHFSGKLPWKVDWAVKWKVIGVTVEGAGKDHMTAGGSHDIASQVCEKVLGYPTPYPINYEFFLIGGKKMSSSKGLGSSAKEMSEILPPYLLRFLFVKTDYKQAIGFDPRGNLAIPDLFDEYDKCWEAYDKGGDEKLARIYELSQVGKIPEKEKGFFIPRFREVANYLSQGFSLDEIVGKLAETKKGKIDDSEMGIIKERVKYAKIWLEKYAPDEYRFEMTERAPEQVKSLSSSQRNYLKGIIKIFNEDETAESLQISLYELAKQLKVPTAGAFAAIYLSFIGKTHGPRAGMLLSKIGKEKTIQRIKEIVK
jgi:lysyl-tRNA synthetase class 1